MLHVSLCEIVRLISFCEPETSLASLAKEITTPRQRCKGVEMTRPVKFDKEHSGPLEAIPQSPKRRNLIEFQKVL